MAVQILDGAIGTELIGRGLKLDGADWSARAVTHAPDLLAEEGVDLDVQPLDLDLLDVGIQRLGVDSARDEERESQDQDCAAAGRSNV